MAAASRCRDGIGNEIKPAQAWSDTMMKADSQIKEQLRRNLVALISLTVAVASLGYNTWRNEASEHNRNQRVVSIEILRNLGELQQVVLHRHWDMDEIDKGNPRTGWAIVLSVHDLAMVLEEPLPDTAENSRSVWDANWQGLGSADVSLQRILEALDAMRDDVHALLQSLD